MAEKEMQSADVCTHKNKIKTSFAKIFVSGTPDRPDFNILYFDPVDQDYHVGFGSYCLEYVFKRLSDEFEIEDAPAADVAPVVHGLWMPIRESEMTGWDPAVAGRDPIGGYICSVCKEEAVYDCNDEFVLSKYCPNCGAKMDGGDGDAAD